MKKYPISKKKEKELKGTATLKVMEKMYGGTRKDYSESNLQEIKQRLNKIFKIIIILLVFVGAFLIWRDMRFTNNGWEYVYGEANLFPIESASKNYRVKARWEISSVPHGIYSEKKTYNIERVFWPNGGSTNMEDCIITPLEKKDICLDSDFKEWRVEVQKDYNKDFN